MYRVKKFKKSETFVDAKGDKHVILVYGELTKTNHLDGVATVRVKYVDGDKRIVDFIDEPTIINTKDSFASVKSFNFGWAVCEPSDEFNEEKGIEICKRRFGRTPITTQEGKFLTNDMIEAILANEIEYVKREKLTPKIKYESPKLELKEERIVNGEKREVCDGESHERYKDGDILRVVYKNGTVAFAAYHSVDHERNTVTFYWLVSTHKDTTNTTFSQSFFCLLTENISVFKAVEKAKRNDILEIEKLLENKFNKKWNWKTKRLELKDASKRRSILDFFC